LADMLTTFIFSSSGFTVSPAVYIGSYGASSWCMDNWYFFMFHTVQNCSHHISSMCFKYPHTLCTGLALASVGLIGSTYAGPHLVACAELLGGIAS